MSVARSQRPIREWLLLLLALVVVGAIVVPSWFFLSPPDLRDQFTAGWGPMRFARLLLGPAQAFCYLCFVWASFILIRRRIEVTRQRIAFGYELLPTEEGARILPEDARPLVRKVDQMMLRRGASILANMIRLGLNKYAVSKSGPDVAEVVRNQAEVEQSRYVATMNTVNYLVWAIPAIGFLGTVAGLAGAMGQQQDQSGDTLSNIQLYIGQIKGHLGTAFDCTFVALALSLVLMYLLHMVQRAEETLVIDCQDYCQEHLLLRLYDPPPADAGTLVLAAR